MVAEMNFEQALGCLWFEPGSDYASGSELRSILTELRPLPDVAHNMLASTPQTGSLTKALSAVIPYLATEEIPDLPVPSPYDQAIAAVARVPTAVAVSRGVQTASNGLGAYGSHASYCFACLTGESPSNLEAEALDTYLTSIMEHGLNVSAFVARVIASSGVDLGPAVQGAFAGLQGPRHGGTPARVLRLLNACFDEEPIQSKLQSIIRRGESIPGFGHALYRTRDPRAEILERACDDLVQGSGKRGRELLQRTQQLEEEALAVFSRKGAETVHANIGLYTAPLFETLGIPIDVFPAAICSGRVGGWAAHIIEQQDRGDLIRPLGNYVGTRPPYGSSRTG